MVQIVPVVVLKHVVRAPQADVFRAWSDPALIRRWLVPPGTVAEEAALDLRVGGAFLLRTAGADGAAHTVTGIYETVRRGHHLHQTWTYDGPETRLRVGESVVQVDLLSVGDRATEITLTHRRIVDPDIRDAYRAYWRTCFERLQGALG